MNLKKKKILAAKTLQVGNERIRFDPLHLAEIKDAISKQDIRDLFNQGIISVKEIKGRKAVKKRKNRRRFGSIRKRTIRGKTLYVILTRKLRAYLFELRKKNKISPDLYNKIRKEIKASIFKSKSHLKERIESEKK
ncbi:MAG: 50S ribosomal protein L19e [Nanoarchaeota archaeon]